MTALSLHAMDVKPLDKRRFAFVPYLPAGGMRWARVRLKRSA